MPVTFSRGSALGQGSCDRVNEWQSCDWNAARWLTVRVLNAYAVCVWMTDTLSGAVTVSVTGIQALSVSVAVTRLVDILDCSSGQCVTFGRTS